jgi:hypothetical protein
MEGDIKKLERKAKGLLLSKSIPSVKMDIIRSLMKNENIDAEERYRTIIDLVKSCPDKPVKIPRHERVELRETQKVEAITSSIPEAVVPEKKTLVEPAESSIYIEPLYRQYKRLKFFKKRYLIHANNRLGFGLKKRLIPAKRLLRVLKKLSTFQEKVVTQLLIILVEILKDDTIQDATGFNYLRILRKWMMDTPLIRYGMDVIKWMDRIDFEDELRNYVSHFYTFTLLDSETREQVLLLLENKLRLLDDFKKEIVNEKDSEQLKRAKEKRNLAREKAIYEYLMTVRVFLSSVTDGNDPVSKYLRLNYSIDSLSQLLLIINGVLVFKREIGKDDLISYYNILPPSVSHEVWDYSIEYLKKYGKDPESRRRRRIAQLKEELNPYEELYVLVKMTRGGENVLKNVFEYQWKNINKKRVDVEDVYEEDFLTFIDGSINYFNNSYIACLDGSLIYFNDKHKNYLEGSIFDSDYFERDLTILGEIVEEVYRFKVENPNLVIRREEAIRILNGEMRSMSHIGAFLRRIGNLFYQIGWELHSLYGMHKKWLMHEGTLKDADDIRTPLSGREVDEFYKDIGQPIPFYDCTIKGFQKGPLLSKLLSGKQVIGNTIQEGVLSEIIAFCYQIAHECKDDEVLNDLENRRDLLRRIKELTGK